MTYFGEQGPADFNAPGDSYFREALAGLSIRQLTEIYDNQAAYPDYNFNAIYRERNRRTGELEELRLCSPQVVESPAYDFERPEAYFAAIRKAAVAAKAPANIIRDALTDEQSQRIFDMAGRFTWQHRSDLPAVSPSRWLMTPARWQRFLAFNMQTAFVAPRAEAYRNYETTKRDILRTHAAGLILINTESVRDSARELDVTFDHIRAARQEIRDLRCVTTSPDFFQLDPELQQAIATAFGEEWIELVNLLHTIEPRVLHHRLFWPQAVLAYRSPSDLRQLLETFPADEYLKHKDICKGFLTTPVGLESLKHILEGATKRKLLREQYAAQAADQSKLVKQPEAAPQPTPEPEAQAEQLTDNMYQIMELLNDEDIVPRVLEAVSGEKVALTEVDSVIPKAKFDEIIDKHIQLIGRAMWERLPDQNPRGVTLEAWNRFNVGETMRSKHHGSLRNLTVTLVALDEARLDHRVRAAYKPTGIEPEGVTCLVFEAEMKSTGKKSEPIFLNMLLVVRRYKDYSRRDSILKSKSSAKTNAEAVAMGIQLDTEAIGRRATAEAYRHPLLGGIPGSRRHKT